jgi:hypothetical protein
MRQSFIADGRDHPEIDRLLRPLLRMGGADQPACSDPDYDYPRQSSQARLLLFADLASENTAHQAPRYYAGLRKSVRPAIARSDFAALL